MSRTICAALALLLLSGCALLGEPPKPEPIAVDTFCLQKKRAWSIDDSPITIREAEVFNATIDHRCGTGKSS